MVNDDFPIVDVVVLSRCLAPLHPEVQAGLDQQQEVRTVLHRVLGAAKEDDQCRYETIVRARNEGRARGAASWLMYLDDDVALDSRCLVTLIEELSRRPALAALAADYLQERRLPGIAPHVAMGATIFRRSVLAQLEFRWTLDRCECQCCCDDLRRRRWGIDYSRTATARHLDGNAMREPRAALQRANAGGCSQSQLGSSDLQRRLPLTACDGYGEGRHSRPAAASVCWMIGMRQTERPPFDWPTASCSARASQASDQTAPASSRSE